MSFVPASAFTWTQAAEPHAARRKALLKKYPEVTALYGPCRRTKYICALLVVIQIFAAWALRDAPWWLILLAAYCFGGVVNQALLLAIHELSHNLAFKKPLHNRLFALLVNLPIGVPVAATFRFYHLLHHTRQGDELADTDLPTEFEARRFSSRIAKLVWLAGQGFAYALRPLFTYPKKPDAWEVSNFALQVLFNLALFELFGMKALLYLPISSLMVMGLHPVAGHFISEHYVFKPGQETYSYYGPLNALTFNVGFHNEHHDFPYIPGSRLGQLKRLAPEFYEPLFHHSSWTKTLWRYVTDPRIGPYSRVKRPAATRVTPQAHQPDLPKPS